MTRILICGYYGLGNIGDEAILSGMLNSLSKNLPEPNFSVITSDAVDTKNLHGVTPVEQSIKKGAIKFFGNQAFKGEFVRLNKEINECDVFILGGGGILQDNKPYYLPAYLSMLQLAKKRKKKTVVYGIGAGPIETKLGKYLCKKVLNQIDLVSVRDIESKSALENAGVKNVVQTADPAFGNDIPEKNILLKQLTPEEEGLPENFFCTTLHSKLYNDDIYRKTNGKGINLELRRKKIAGALDRITKEFNKDLMCVPTAPPDYKGFLDIKQIMENDNNILIMRHDSNFKRTVALLSKCKILIGMRLHSMILASMIGVPFVPIIYSNKVKSFLDISGLSNLCMDIEEIEEDYFEERLIENSHKIYENHERYSGLVIENSKSFRQKTIENARMVGDLIK